MNRVITFLMMLAILAVLRAAPPKREFRGAWLTTVYAIDWPSKSGSNSKVVELQKAELDRYLDRFNEINLTTVCFQVRSLADALYQSNREPWAAVASGTRGSDPGWDPLQYVIDGCHRRGLECYAWINPFRWSAGPDYNTSFDRKFKEKSLLLNYDKYTVFNPALPEVRAHIIEVCREIITNYNLDGILFDDYFYPNNIPENETAADWELFQQSGEKEIGQWRRDNINFVVTEICDMIARTKPEMRFGIGPAGVAGKSNTSAPVYGVEPCPVEASDWQYSTIYSDPLAWLVDGTVDFISPQLYWPTTHKTAPYEPLTQWWSKIAAKYGRYYYASQSTSFLDKEDTPQGRKEIAEQIELNRRYAVDGSSPGSCFFSARQLLGTVGNDLKNGVFSKPAIPPAVTWKFKNKYGAVEHLKLENGRLGWSAVKPVREGALVRYTVYAIPPGVSLSQESSAEIPGEYLLGVTYFPSYAIPEVAEKGWTYAVTVLDGLGIEHIPAFIEN